MCLCARTLTGSSRALVASSRNSTSIQEIIAVISDDVDRYTLLIKMLLPLMLAVRNARASLHTSAVLCGKRAGRYKRTKKQDFPLTYEMANKPDMIGVRKSWNSFNTSALKDGTRKAESAQEDIVIRKFIYGTWPQMLLSEILIKRRANQIIIAFIFLKSINPTKAHFLIGYSEEILSCVLKCPVKLELQAANSDKDLVYQYI